MTCAALLETLTSLYEGEHERVGFVLKDGSVIECVNVSGDPENSFEVAAEEIIQWCDEAEATWHTHPNTDNNLSTNDYEMFLTWASLDHYIVGQNGVRRYIVEDGDVLIA